MTTIRLHILFHTPFRVSQGYGMNGVDDVIDDDNPLSAASLKGVLRDSARTLLPGEPGASTDHDLVAAVFGRRGRHGSPWHFSDAEIAVTDRVYRERTRVRLGENRKAAPGGLFVGQELHATRATATITQTRPIPDHELPRHVALLHLAARLVDGIGASRRRGLGWVTITTDDADLPAYVTTILGGKP